MKPILNLDTLNAVHEAFHFVAKNKLEMDMWLHEEIMRAMHGRELTDDERKHFLVNHFAAEAAQPLSGADSQMQQAGA